MVTQPYRRSVTLESLLTGQGGAAPVAPGPPQPDYLGGDDGGLPPGERNRLLQILMQPDDVGPPPEIDEGNLGTNIGSNIFAGIGDALGAYASILGGGRAPNFMQQLQEKREFDKALKRQHGQRKAGAETDAKRRTAEYLLSQDDAKLQRQQELADKKAEAQEKAALAKIQDENKLTDAALKRGQELADADRKRKHDLEDAETKFGYDKVLAGIRAKDSDGDPDSKHDKKALFGAKGLFAEIGELVETGSSGLQDGSVSPDQMAQIVEQRIEEEGLSEQGAEAVRLLFKKRITPIIRGVEAQKMNEDLAAGSPQQANPFWDPLRALGRARSGK